MDFKPAVTSHTELPILSFLRCSKVQDIEIQLPFWEPSHNSYTPFLNHFQSILNGAGNLSEYICGLFISKIPKFL